MNAEIKALAQFLEAKRVLMRENASKCDRLANENFWLGKKDAFEEALEKMRSMGLIQSSDLKGKESKYDYHVAHSIRR
jgi:hypothetical protein